MRSSAAVAQRGHGRPRATAAPGWLTTGLITRVLIVVGLALGALQGWSTLKIETPAAARPVVPAESIAAIQITLGQAALALRDFGKSNLLSDRFDFESGLSKVRRSVETLEGTAMEQEEHQALGRARFRLDHLNQIEKEHIARTDAGGGSMGTEKLAEIARLRDEAALALTDFQEVGARRVMTAEPDPLTRLLRGSAGAGAALLSLCVGAITLWGRLFPA
jgi:hypothetical protein